MLDGCQDHVTPLRPDTCKVPAAGHGPFMFTRSSQPTAIFSPTPLASIIPATGTLNPRRVSTMATGGNTVFIGNIPYGKLCCEAPHMADGPGTTEEEVREILGRAGAIEKFRALMDKETGKPRGYAFAEFKDADSAASAVRNLNNFELKGRKLRVDYANDKGDRHEFGASDSHALQPAAPGAALAATGPAALPTLPAGIDLPPGMSATMAVDQTLGALPPTQLVDVITQVQVLATKTPERAYALFEAAPQLAYAVFQALLLMDLANPNDVARIIEEEINAGKAPPMASHALAAAHQAAQRKGQEATYGPPHTAQTQAYVAPAAAPVQPLIADPSRLSDPSNANLIGQVLNMPPEKLAGLAPEVRATVLQLRNQIMQQFGQR
jgi:cleavage stimulation factor subunit 2